MSRRMEDGVANDKYEFTGETKVEFGVRLDATDDMEE